jgi:uncharacterized OsmC-like protein
MEEMETRELHLTREGSSAIASLRGFELFVDEPEEKGGKNRGPRPTEYLLVALAGCYTATFLRIAEKRKQIIERMECNVKGDIDREENRVKRAEVSLTVYASITDEEIEIVNRLAEKSCTVKNSLNTEVVIRAVRA